MYVSMDTFMTGLRLADLRFEHAAYERLLTQESWRHRPKYVAECLKKVWHVVESPMILLGQQPPG